MAASEVRQDRAMRRAWRRCAVRLAAAFGGSEAARQQPDRGALDIALAAGDLAGEAPGRVLLQPQRAVEQRGRIEERVAVQAAEPREFCVLQARNGAEHAHLL